MKPKTPRIILLVALVAVLLMTCASASGMYFGSRKSDVYHYPYCGQGGQIKEENVIWFADENEATRRGYRPCSYCHPPLPTEPIAEAMTQPVTAPPQTPAATAPRPATVPTEATVPFTYQRPPEATEWTLPAQYRNAAPRKEKTEEPSIMSLVGGVCVIMGLIGYWIKKAMDENT